MELLLDVRFIFSVRYYQLGSFFVHLEEIYTYYVKEFSSYQQRKIHCLENFKIIHMKIY